MSTVRRLEVSICIIVCEINLDCLSWNGRSTNVWNSFILWYFGWCWTFGFPSILRTKLGILPLFLSRERSQFCVRQYGHFFPDVLQISSISFTQMLIALTFIPDRLLSYSIAKMVLKSKYPIPESLKIFDSGMSVRIFWFLKILKKRKKKKTERIEKILFPFFDLYDGKYNVFAKTVISQYTDTWPLVKKPCKKIGSQRSYRSRHLVARYLFVRPKMGLRWGLVEAFWGEFWFVCRGLWC